MLKAIVLHGTDECDFPENLRDPYQCSYGKVHYIRTGTATKTFCGRVLAEPRYEGWHVVAEYGDLHDANMSEIDLHLVCTMCRLHVVEVARANLHRHQPRPSDLVPGVSPTHCAVCRAWFHPSQPSPAEAPPRSPARIDYLRLYRDELRGAGWVQVMGKTLCPECWPR